MSRRKARKRSKLNIKPSQPTLNKKLIGEFKQFMEYHPANRLSRNLRKMLIEFLMYDGATEATYLQELLWDFEGLFALLDAINSSITTIDSRQ